jgi:alpha-ketoglutarate-dependent 2,4-dichlorophenoxyacetate dioxygenase
MRSTMRPRRWSKISYARLADVLPRRAWLHRSAEERERFKPVRQRLVRTHPVTGRKSLYLSAHAGTIVGWSEPEAKALLMDLTETATQREFVYAHKWRVGDLLMWDNRRPCIARGRSRMAKRATSGGRR